MEAKHNKSVSRIIQCFSLFLVLNLLEQFVVFSRHVDTKGVVACIGGFAVLLIYIRFINKPLEEIGMIFSGHKFRKGLLLAILFNLIPTVAVFGLEYRHYAMMSGDTRLTLFYNNVANSYSSAGLGGFLKWAAICLLISVIHAFFYEMTFRGLLITLGSRSLHFWVINTIQTALYTLWFMIPAVRQVLTGYFNNRYFTAKQILIILLAVFAYEILTSVKLGLLRSSTGSVWACIFDHIAFMYILAMVHVQYTNYMKNPAEVLTDNSYYVRIIAYQAVSLLLVIVYYSFKKKKIQEKHREHEMQMEQTI